MHDVLEPAQGAEGLFVCAPLYGLTVYAGRQVALIVGLRHWWQFLWHWRHKMRLPADVWQQRQLICSQIVACHWDLGCWRAVIAQSHAKTLKVVFHPDRCLQPVEV